MLRGLPRRPAGARPMLAEAWKKRIDIRTPDLGNNILSLSGGNQQKVLFARALGSVAGIVLMDDPMRGVDIGTKQEVYGMMRAEAATAAGPSSGTRPRWMKSAICDHVYVFREGPHRRRTARGDDLTEDKVLDSLLRGGGGMTGLLASTVRA